jgi:hypothetical protein
MRVSRPTVPGFNVRQNLVAADAALQFTPEERALYERHLANQWGPGGVDNPDQSRSTLYQMGTDIDGKTYNLPTVYDGRILPPDDAFARAMALGINTFPSYPSPDAAEARYQRMHDYMDRDAGAYSDVRHGPMELYRPRGGLF